MCNEMQAPKDKGPMAQKNIWQLSDKLGTRLLSSRMQFEHVLCTASPICTQRSPYARSIVSNVYTT